MSYPGQPLGRCAGCGRRVVVPTAGGVPPSIDHAPGCPNVELSPREAIIAKDREANAETIRERFDAYDLSKVDPYDHAHGLDASAYAGADGCDEYGSED